MVQYRIHDHVAYRISCIAIKFHVSQNHECQGRSSPSFVVLQCRVELWGGYDLRPTSVDATF